MAGYRLYGSADCERLRFIRQAKALGLTLAEIGEVLALRDGGTCPCPHVPSLIDHTLAVIEARLRILTDLHQELRALCETTATASQGRIACRSAGSSIMTTTHRRHPPADDQAFLDLPAYRKV